MLESGTVLCIIGTRMSSMKVSLLSLIVASIEEEMTACISTISALTSALLKKDHTYIM